MIKLDGYEAQILQDTLHAAREYYATLSRPSMLFKPALSIDGNQWCALFGESLQDGVAGFGDTPELAYVDFDVNWYTYRAKKSTEVDE